MGVAAEGYQYGDEYHEGGNLMEDTMQECDKDALHKLEENMRKYDEAQCKEDTESAKLADMRYQRYGLDNLMNCFCMQVAESDGVEVTVEKARLRYLDGSEGEQKLIKVWFVVRKRE